MTFAARTIKLRALIVAQQRVGALCGSKQFLRLLDADNRQVGRVQQFHLHERQAQSQQMYSWVSLVVDWLPRRRRQQDHHMFNCGPLGDAERRTRLGTANWNDGIGTDRSARHVRHLMPGAPPHMRVRSTPH